MTARASDVIRQALVAVVAMAVALAVPAAAAADEGLSTTTSTRYVLDPNANVVHVTDTITVTNTKADRGPTYYYWDLFNDFIPDSAERVRATSHGSTLRVSLIEAEGGYGKLAQLHFPSRLLTGQSRTIELTYDIAGSPPRSDDPTRIGPGYATFFVSSLGDAGHASAQVVLPRTMTVYTSTDDYTTEEGDDSVTYTFSTPSSDGTIWATISARQSTSDDTEVTVDQRGLTLHPYANDPEWTTFVSAHLDQGLEVLEQLIGSSLPSRVETIREDAGVTVEGYAGWYDGTDIVLGEDLDATTLYHELTHAWANTATIAARWIQEGLAELLATRVVDATDRQGERYDPVARDDRDALALDVWNEAATSEEDIYAYPAAYQTMNGLLEGLDEQQFTAIVAGVVAGATAYDGHDGAPAVGGRTTTQRLIDLIEAGGTGALPPNAVNSTARDLIQRWVTAGPLDWQAREQALTSYTAYDTGDGEWDPPLGLRRRMAAWEFAGAADLFSRLAGADAEAAQFQQVVAEGDLTAPESVEAGYEAAVTREDIEAMRGELTSALDAARAVVAASHSRPGGPIAALGAFVLRQADDARAARAAFARGDFDAATAKAAEASALASRAWLVGLALIAGGLLALVGLAGGSLVVIRRRGRSSSLRDGAEEPGQHPY